MNSLSFYAVKINDTFIKKYQYAAVEKKQTGNSVHFFTPNF